MSRAKLPNKAERVREYKKKYKIKTKETTRQYVQGIKANSSCIICGETYPKCLEFHHTDRTTKVDAISSLVKQGYNLLRIQEEIDKCIILCSNCHRKENPCAGLYMNLKGKFVFALKLESRCITCGESFVGCLDFHHIDENTKILNIGAMIRDKRYSLDDVKTEIAKCEILCSNCHRRHHN